MIDCAAGAARYPATFRRCPGGPEPAFERQKKKQKEKFKKRAKQSKSSRVSLPPAPGCGSALPANGTAAFGRESFSGLAGGGSRGVFLKSSGNKNTK